MVLASRDLSRMDALLGSLGVSRVQAPLRAAPVACRVELPRTFAHVMHNCGFGEPSELRVFAGAWRRLFEQVAPDLILFDHSPTALLAARGLPARRALIGTGFCCPPAVSPWPDFRPWLADDSPRLNQDEERVLGNANQALTSWHVEPLRQLSELYADVDETFLATYRELDHYPDRVSAQYWGTWPSEGGDLPVWPSVPGKRIFAYLKPFQHLRFLLHVLHDLRLPVLVYMERRDASLQAQYQSPTLRFASNRLDLAAVSRECERAVLHGGHASTAIMLLAGVPVLQIPLNLEQAITGITTTRLGAGLSADAGNTTQIAHKLNLAITSNDLCRGAAAFAARYAAYDSAEQTRRVALRITELASGEENETLTSSALPSR